MNIFKGSSLVDTFILNTQTGMLCLNKTLDRETTPTADIVIQALEDCYRCASIFIIHTNCYATPKCVIAIQEKILNQVNNSGYLGAII